MKVYISADLEGVTGSTSWSETDIHHEDSQRITEQMTEEVAAACRGAIEAGGTEIWVKDAHETGRNIDGRRLPKEVKLIRGWSGHPFCMVDGLNDTFNAALFIGYHAAGNTLKNPLAHTLNPTDVAYIKLNDQLASEFLVHAYAAASVKVPVVFVSGDQGICEEVKRLNNDIETLSVKMGLGSSTINISPQLAIEQIQESVKETLKKDLDLCKIQLPKKYEVEIGYHDHVKAFRASFYPGVKLHRARTITYKAVNYMDVLTMLNFLT